ncbi:MAG: hypothetical protein NT027_12300 [Proteobacteria bacterium]|nr:hypothetical protein [Pseudomonadota bacterium]
MRTLNVLEIGMFRRLVSKIAIIPCLALTPLTGIYSCSSNSQDDGADLEAEEPVEAADAETESEGEGESDSKPAATEGEDKSKGADTKDMEAVEPEAPASGTESGSTPKDASGTPTVSSPAAGDVPVASGNRRVMYVKSNGVKIYSESASSSKVIGKLKKGDHLLVNIDGEWDRTDDGKFIAMKDLSEKGIGRGKPKKNQWISPGKKK